MMTSFLRTSLFAAALGAIALTAGCGADAADDAGAGSAKPVARSYAQRPVIIYSNADEEAQAAIKKALDANGFSGKYLMQSFGTSELGGKLTAEGKHIEADVVTLSSFYLESLQQRQKLFAPLAPSRKTLEAASGFFAPILGLSSAIFVNTWVLEEDHLPRPKSIADLADPVYKNDVAVPDIMGSSTAWLMTLALVSAYGETQGTELARRIEANAGPHCEKSGSGPLKMVRAGEAAVGFGLRHQAVYDKARDLPIDFIDPVEGNFTLLECAAVVDKGEATHPDAKKVIDVIVEHARPELLKYYPVPLYEGEKVEDAYRLGNPKSFGKPLTAELLQTHQKLVKGR